MRRIVTLGVILLLVLTLGASAFASAAASQTWYLTDTLLPGPAGYYEMDQVTPVALGTDVPVAASSAEIWKADQQSQGVTFPAGNWGIEKFTVEECAGDPDMDCTVLPYPPILDDIDIAIGYVGHSGFTSVTEVTMSSLTVRGCGIGIKNADLVAVPSFTVASGDFLAVRVTNNNATTCIAVNNGYDGRSVLGQIHSPSTDPGYPIPELAAGVLLALGLGGLIGYVAWRRQYGKV